MVGAHHLLTVFERAIMYCQCLYVCLYWNLEIKTKDSHHNYTTLSNTKKGFNSVSCREI